MAKSIDTKPSDFEADEGVAVDLKDRHFAAFLTWLVPGAGQWYQGRHGKAWLFFVCVMGTFVFGLFLGEGRVVYAQWQPAKDRRYSFLGQIGVGLPSLPALVGAARQTPGGEETLPFVSERWYMPPNVNRRSEVVNGREIELPSEMNQLHYDLNRRFELGTVFTLIAGLLNVLVIYDAWAGPAFTAPRKKDEKPSEAERAARGAPGEDSPANDALPPV